MSAEGVGKFIERAVHALLPGYTRARDLEGARDELLFEDRGAKRLLRFDIGHPKDHVWMVAFSFVQRPDVAGSPIAYAEPKLQERRGWPPSHPRCRRTSAAAEMDRALRE